MRLRKERKVKKSAKIKPRDWQLRGMEAIRKDILSPDCRNFFLVKAATGGGKTLFAGFVAKAMMDGSLIEGTKIKEINRIIVVSPSIQIKSDFKNSVHEIGVHLTADEKASSSTILRSSSVFDGMIFTYQAVSTGHIGRLANVWRENGDKILLILDEVHHLTHFNEWGTQIEFLKQQVEYTIAMTGTPWRGDQQRILGINYDDEGQPIPDFSYTKKEGVRDETVRYVEFLKTPGYVLKDNGDGTSRSIPFSDLEQERLHGYKNNVFDPTSNFMEEVIEEANLISNQIDEEEDNAYKAAVLVLCKDIRHAKVVNRHINRMYPDNSIVVSSDSSFDEVKAHDLIKAFKTSEKRYIVAVGMIKEGVDIPRIRTVLWATDTRSLQEFEQCVGRAVRAKNKWEKANVIMPTFPWMVEMAKRYELEQGTIAFDHGVVTPPPKEEDDPDDPNDPRIGPDYPPEPPDDIFEIPVRDDLTVFGRVSGSIFLGDEFTDEEKAEAIELIKQIKKSFKLLGVPCGLHVSDEIAALEALHKKRMQEKEEAEDEDEELSNLPLEDQRKEKCNIIHSKISRYTKLKWSKFYTDVPGEKYPEEHARLQKMFKYMSLKDLRLNHEMSKIDSIIAHLDDLLREFETGSPKAEYHPEEFIELSPSLSVSELGLNQPQPRTMIQRMDNSNPQISFDLD